ncbi:MAG TPA: ABC transporter permease, partial [Chloroflexota bacterium]|nr:ABC transporter permease [Chloroflexota bacterium]
ELLAYGGGRRGPISLLIMVGVAGVFLPLSLSHVWFSSPAPVLVAVYIPLVMITTVIADSFAGERERHTLETLLASRLSELAILLGKVGAAVLYAWVLALASLLVALITANVVAPAGVGIRLYSAPTGLAAFGISFLVSVLWAAVGVLTSLRAATVRQAQQRLSVAMLVVFLIPGFALSALPPALKSGLLGGAANGPTAGSIGALALLVLDAVLLAAAVARFRRDQLIS